MVIAYDDRPAFIQAGELRFQLARSCKNNIEIESIAWNFALLGRSKQLREQAAIEAADADMLVVAAGATSQPPEHVQTWVENWLAAKRGRHAALVALLHSVEEASDQPPAIENHLRRLAEMSEVEFFCNLGPRDVFQFAAPLASRENTGLVIAA